jgi:transposase
MNAEDIAKRYQKLTPFLDEKQRRILAAVEGEILGSGGISVVARATGLSRNTVKRGRVDLREASSSETSHSKPRVRLPGGGRKKATEKDPDLNKALEVLIEPNTRGDPQSPLRWTCKSLRRLSTELSQRGHRISHVAVGELLRKMGYSLQANRKTREGSSHPDRNAQFEHIYGKVKEFQAAGQPVISVDAKKKELVGAFKNGGREWNHRSHPVEVNVYDFEPMSEGRVTPYGVYDMTKNAGWVSVGIDHDTSAFAVESIRRWWLTMGREAYPHAERLLITADGGGSNGSRVRLWKKELRRLCDETGMAITVSHFPPGTSKWNKIEHRLFSFISQNWRGKPLISHEVIVNLIAAATTRKGLRVMCAVDEKEYPKGIKVSDKEMKEIGLIKEAFHGEWNYAFNPKNGAH